MSHKKKDVSMGFTLIEVMLALFITAILMTMLSIVFNTGLRAYRQGKDILDIARKAQLVMDTITSELSGAIIVPNVTFTNENMDNAVFFMAPVDNSGALDLCELGYFRDSSTNELKRYLVTKGSNSYYNYPGVVSYTPNVASLLDTFCEDVTIFELHYYNGTNWSANWGTPTKLPEMVEIKLKIQGKYPSNAPAQKMEFITRVYLPNSTNN